MTAALLAIALAVTLGDPWILAQRAGTVSPPAKTFKARLAPVPIDVTMQATISGSGTVTAVLTGPTLTIDGTFEGLRSPATVAHVHIGQKGVRGPSFFDLTASSGTSGTIRGTIQLTPLQVTALERGSVYIQLHSEKAPDGNLWGWLLQPEVKR